MKLQPSLSHMVEVEGYFVIGPEHAYEVYNRDVIQHDDGKYLVIHACKDPAHRQRLGYTGHSAPKGEYYLSVHDIGDKRDDLYLNLIDGRSKVYMPDALFEEVILAMRTALIDKRKIVVYCNKGQSRSPGLVLMYLLRANYKGITQKSKTLEDAIKTFREEYYPHISLGMGMYEVLEESFIDDKARYQGKL